MREILFRGKRLQGGDWVEGYFFKSDINKRARESGKATLIFTPDCDTFITVPECHNSFMVASDTVGQYTGLKDKHGKRIFEGDIIKIDNGEQSSISVVKFGEYYPKMFYVMMDIYFPIAQHINANGFFAESTKHEDMILFKSPFFEIIGNVHDNPELLKK